MLLKLLIQQRRSKGIASRYVEVDKEYCLIGRGNADIRLQEPRCSRHHALIGVTPEGQPFLKDLGSTNGTLLNGERVHEKQLHAGDDVRIGNSLISVVAIVVDLPGADRSPEEEWRSWRDTSEDMLSARRQVRAKQERDSASRRMFDYLDRNFRRAA